MRLLLLASTLAILTSATAHAQQVVDAIKNAQNQIIAYLPSPTSVRIAQALKRHLGTEVQDGLSL